jgi:hypothetical protein
MLVNVLFYAPDMTLTDEHTRMVNTLCKANLEYLGLKATLQEILNLERKHVIQTHAGLIEHTNAHKTTDEGVTLEETLGVLIVELE